jgi:hypothetical protein
MQALEERPELSFTSSLEEHRTPDPGRRYEVTLLGANL